MGEDLNPSSTLLKTARTLPAFRKLPSTDSQATPVVYTVWPLGFRLVL